MEALGHNLIYMSQEEDSKMDTITEMDLSIKEVQSELFRNWRFANRNDYKEKGDETGG